jgi:nitrile hydratase
VDGIHDMGGMHGFGRVVPAGTGREAGPEVDEPVFHAPWEGRTLGLMIATGARGLRDGSIRPAIEAIDPATYLASSYYERWARAVEAQVVAAGHLTTAEIDERAADGGTEPVRSDATDPDLVAALPAFLDAPRERSGEPVPARFAVGDRVTVARMAPVGHHRCPRYVRGVAGEVVRVPGGWPPPGEAGDTEATYTVRFAMRDLWGDDAEPGHVYIDLWERYLT